MAYVCSTLHCCCFCYYSLLWLYFIITLANIDHGWLLYIIICYFLLFCNGNFNSIQYFMREGAHPHPIAYPLGCFVAHSSDFSISRNTKHLPTCTIVGQVLSTYYLYNFYINDLDRIFLLQFHQDHLEPFDLSQILMQQWEDE